MTTQMCPFSVVFAHPPVIVCCAVELVEIGVVGHVIIAGVPCVDSTVTLKRRQ